MPISQPLAGRRSLRGEDGPSSSELASFLRRWEAAPSLPLPLRPKRIIQGPGERGKGGGRDSVTLSRRRLSVGGREGGRVLMALRKLNPSLPPFPLLPLFLAVVKKRSGRRTLSPPHLLRPPFFLFFCFPFSPSSST